MIRSHRLLVLTSLFVGAGCFTLQPVPPGAVAPEMGERLDVTLNDAGRLALGPAIGSSVDRIDGILVEKDSSGMTLAVKHVIALDGSVQVWSDEPVRVEDVQVRTLSRRQFSAARTALLGAAGAGGFTFAVTSGLIALGGEAGNSKGDTLGESIIRVIRP